MKIMYNLKWYRPMEIAKLGLIQGRKGSAGTLQGHYNHVLELIKAGKLQAYNHSHGQVRNNWLVSENAIKAYYMRKGWKNDVVETEATK